MIVALNPGGLLGCFVALVFVIGSIVKMDRERFFADVWAETLARRCNAGIYYSLYLIGGAIAGNIMFDRLTEMAAHNPMMSSWL